MITVISVSSVISVIQLLPYNHRILQAITRYNHGITQEIAYNRGMDGGADAADGKGGAVFIHHGYFSSVTHIAATCWPQKQQNWQKFYVLVQECQPVQRGSFEVDDFVWRLRICVR